MPEFLHQVVAKRERSNAIGVPGYFSRMLEEQLQRSYAALTTANSSTTVIVGPSQNFGNIARIVGNIYVREHSYSRVDAYIRANVYQHQQMFSTPETHSHEGNELRLVLDSVSFNTFRYNCYWCGVDLVAPERISRIEVVYDGASV